MSSESGSVKSVSFSSVNTSSKGAAMRMVALIVFGHVSSDKYLAKNMPPRECPIKIMFSFTNSRHLSSHSFHSA